MQTLPNQAPQQPIPEEDDAGEGVGIELDMDTEEGDDPQMLLQQLDAHIAGLPPEMVKVFEDGFKEYPKMPEVLSTLMPEAYEYFKTVQMALTQQPQGQAPQGAPQNSPAAGGTPAAQPVGEPAQSPLMGGAQPAKATSALGI